MSGILWSNQTHIAIAAIKSMQMFASEVYLFIYSSFFIIYIICLFHLFIFFFFAFFLTLNPVKTVSAAFFWWLRFILNRQGTFQDAVKTDFTDSSRQRAPPCCWLVNVGSGEILLIAAYSNLVWSSVSDWVIQRTNS